MEREMHDADLLDPNPDIHALFCHYNHLYFNDALGACTVDWSSKRMTLCAGICQYMKMGGCAIRLSEPLLKFRSTTDLKNTLLHEMIHAYLWLTNGNKDHNDHGPCFRKVMMDINISALPDHQRPACGYNITVYHNFSDEVDNYRTHHWKCKNCGDLIKRAMNRQPSASDCMIRTVNDELCNDTRCHWHQHRRNCGGEYIKIAEPAGYQDKRRNTKSNGKQDQDGKVKDETDMKKVNKTRSVSVHTKEENVKGVSSHKTRNLESFYHKLEKEKENVNLNEHFVIDEKDSDEDSEEIFIIKRRKCNPEVRIKDGSSITLRAEVEQRIKNNHEEREKAVSCSTPIPEVEQKLHMKEERTSQQLDHVDGGSGTCRNDFNVIIKWKGWYAHEREDDEEGIEPLINKRQERRRKEKMLNHIEIQKMGNLQVSVDAARCEKLCNHGDASMLEADRTDTTVSYSQSLIETDVPRLDTSKTGMVGCSSCLISANTDLECSCFRNSGSSQASLPCYASNRTGACVKEGSYFAHINSAKMGFESSFQRNIPTSGMEVVASCDLVRERKSSIFGFIGNGREKFRPSKVVDKKETLHVLDLDLEGRHSANSIQSDEIDMEAASPKIKLLKYETGLSNKHSCNVFSGTIKGDTAALEKMSCSLDISSSESEENCSEDSNLGDEHGKKRVRRLLCLNGQVKGEEKESWQRQVIKAGNAGNSASCPVCDKVLEGDIGEGDFNQRFNAHLDRCIASCS